jgi:soluble lytic murein transglycosylase-like protein
MHHLDRIWNYARTAVSTFLDFAHGGLLMAGFISVMLITAHVTGGGGASSAQRNTLVESLQIFFATPRNEPAAPVETAVQAEPDAVTRYLAQRYRVSGHALMPVVETVHQVGRRVDLDPLLILAVIAVESGFNPLSESVMGAQGLMQVIPRWHSDKLENADDKTALLDPQTNVRIGAMVLRDSIRRSGSLIEGLQQYAGAANAEVPIYANKVLAVRQRLAELKGKSA